MLCDVCDGIQYDNLDQDHTPEWIYPGHPHHQNYAELSSCSNCDFCRLVTSDIASSEVLNQKQEWESYHIGLRVFPTGTGLGDESEKSNLLVYADNDGKQTTLAIYGLFLDRTEIELSEGKINVNFPGSSLIGGRRVSSSSKSEDCFKLANFWLDQCIGNDRRHPQLGQKIHNIPSADMPGVQIPQIATPTGISTGLNARKVSFTPSRTIDVGPPDGQQDPRLVDHKVEDDYIIPLQWVTLSHCWGDSMPLTTKIATLSERQKGIPLDTMPPTFRDAVVVTRRLGFRHIWIDSLCIIQDSDKDWNFEAKHMGNIYKYGVLNIAANTARTCHDGLFTERPKNDAAVCLPFRSIKHNISSHMYVRSGRWDSYQDGIIGPGSTLTSRAWVLQESILSPRTLHYAQRQIFWECEHCTFGEAWVAPMAILGPSSRLSASRWVSNKMVIPAGIAQQSFGQVVPETDLGKRSRLYNSWLQIIMDYTARKLTYRSDLFPALAGAASIFQAPLRDRYLAGLFEGDLLRNLLWRCDNPVSAFSASEIPSWSWASLDAPVKFEITIASSPSVAPMAVGSLNAKVLAAVTYLAEDLAAPANHFLHVSGGSIKFEGYLFPEAPLANLQYVLKALQSNEGDPDVYIRQARLFLDSEQESKDPQDIAILHLGCWEWIYGPNMRNRLETEFAGLVLKATNSTRSSYRRIGIVTVKCGLQDNDQDRHFREEAERLIVEQAESSVITIV